MKQSLQKVSEDFLKLRSLIDALPHGGLLAYGDVETMTGVPMRSHRNREMLRRAIIRCNREYVVIPNVGYRLADVDSAMSVLTHKLRMIDSRVKRADLAQKIIQEQFYTDLPSEDQERVRFLGATFGALRIAAESGRALYTRRQHQIAAGGGQETIPIPLP